MNTRVYIRTLPETATEQSLRAAFAPYGTISKIFVATDRGTALPIYAFVTYTTVEDMTAAITGMNESTFEGHKLAVSMAREVAPITPPKRFVPPPRRGPNGPPRSMARRG